MINNIQNHSPSFKSLILSNDKSTKQNLVKNIANHSLANLDLFNKSCIQTDKISEIADADVFVSSSGYDDSALKYTWKAKIASKDDSDKETIITAFTNPIYATNILDKNDIITSELKAFFQTINSQLTSLARGDKDISENQLVSVKIRDIFSRFNGDK